MSCSCSKKRNLEDLSIDMSTDIQPFDTCINCALKHLSYSLVLLSNNEELRSLGELYLCFRHLDKKYKELSNEVFEVIKLFFKEEKIDNELILNLSKTIQNFDENKTFIFDRSVSNIEFKNFDSIELYILYMITAYELYMEVDYEETNYNWIIGCLLLAAENAEEINRSKIRSYWKNFESFKNFTSEYILFIKEEYKNIKKFYLKNKEL